MHDSIAEQTAPRFTVEDTEDGMWIVTVDGQRVIGSPEFSDEAMAQDYCEGKRRDAEKATTRAAMVAGVRALADFLEEHPDVPVATVWAFAHPEVARDPDQALADAVALRDAAGAEAVEGYGNDLKIRRQFAGRDVEWHASLPRDRVAIPRVDGRTVVWDLPPELVPPTPDAAESGEGA